jgi:predicted component of type VI protein secretion system
VITFVPKISLLAKQTKPARAVAAAAVAWALMELSDAALLTIAAPKVASVSRLSRDAVLPRTDRSVSESEEAMLVGYIDELEIVKLSRGNSTQED